jgi:hypothetical protein
MVRFHLRKEHNRSGYPILTIPPPPLHSGDTLAAKTLPQMPTRVALLPREPGGRAGLIIAYRWYHPNG